MTQLTSGLETADYGTPGWNTIYNKDMELINAVLLKLLALRDVVSTSPSNNSVPTWSSALVKFEHRIY
jgi:hypothetical protein